jgi:hypothetical protein
MIDLTKPRPFLHMNTRYEYEYESCWQCGLSVIVDVRTVTYSDERQRTTKQYECAACDCEWYDAGRLTDPHAGSKLIVSHRTNC